MPVHDGPSEVTKAVTQFRERNNTTTPGNNIAKEEIPVIFEAQAILIKGKEDLLQ